MNILVQPSERESRARLMRSVCNPDCTVAINILTGLHGSRLVIDGLAMQSGLKPSEAMDALHEARRLARIAAWEGIGMLAATLAKVRP